jgi:hypothetical protein
VGWEDVTAECTLKLDQAERKGLEGRKQVNRLVRGGMTNALLPYLRGELQAFSNIQGEVVSQSPLTTGQDQGSSGAAQKNNCSAKQVIHFRTPKP